MKVACVQLNASDNTKDNLVVIEKYIKAAADSGADMVFFPENCTLLTDKKERLFEESKKESEHPALEITANLAKRYGIWVFLGSVPVLIEEHAKLANRSFVFNPKGVIAARYDKIHLFDACLGDKESYRESW